MRDMRGKVALVTGAGSGIGRATALALAVRGARVVAADVADENGAETTRLIEAAGGKAHYVHADVSMSADVEAMVHFAAGLEGRLDFAVNNAGIGGALSSFTADYPEETWHRLIGINLTGVFLCMKHEIPELLKTGRLLKRDASPSEPDGRVRDTDAGIARSSGVIVNMASVMGTVALPGASAYVAAKHGVLGLTKTAALEYGPQGLRVNALCPGFINTPLIRQGGIEEGDDTYRAIAGMHALKRWGTVEEVAAAAAWLCSDEASFAAGAGLLLDGGYAAQ